MSIKDQRSSSSNNRWWLLLAVVAVVVALFMAIGNPAPRPPTEPKAAAGAKSGAVRERMNDSPPVASPAGLAPPRATRSSLNRVAPTLDGEPAAPQFPQVERLLLDQALSEEQAAAGLFEIAMNRELSLEERDEALAHGLNLDFGAFGAMAMDPTLPLPLTQRYFDELLNRNEAPQRQLEGYLGLMSHSEEEIRTQAAQQLAFVLEDEALAETPDELRRVANERLETLKLEPQEKNPAVTEPPANGQNPE